MGRIMHQVGYTTKYGGHGSGFFLAMNAQTVLEGLSVIVVLKSFDFL